MKDISVTSGRTMPAMSRRVFEAILILLAVNLVGCGLAESQSAIPAQAKRGDESPSANPAQVKWNPGHYVRAYLGTDLKWTLDKIKDQPYFKGVQVMHAWTELEKSKGAYDFSIIEQELALLKSHNKRMILQVVDKVFQEKQAPCVPDYVQKDPAYKGGQSVTRKRGGGFNNCVALRWLPGVQDRLIALYSALGARFDRDPTLEAVMTTEGVVTPGGTNFTEYSRAAYISQQKRGMEALAKAFPNTVVYQLINWGGNEIEGVFEDADRLNIGIGGPDTLPTHPSTAYRFYPKYFGRIPLQISVQVPLINKYLKTGEVTLDRVYDFAVTDPKGLRVNHMIWDLNEKHPETSFVNKIMPLVNARKGSINERLPSNRQR